MEVFQKISWVNYQTRDSSIVACMIMINWVNRGDLYGCFLEVQWHFRCHCGPLILFSTICLLFVLTLAFFWYFTLLDTFYSKFPVSTCNSHGFFPTRVLSSPVILACYFSTMPLFSFNPCKLALNLVYKCIATVAVARPGCWQ